MAVRPTNEDIMRFVVAIADGQPVSWACDAIDIDVGIFQQWMRLGKRGEEPYATFRANYRDAKNVARSTLIAKLVGSDDWRAAAFLLERQEPAEFGKIEDQARVVNALAADSHRAIEEAEHRLLAEDNHGKEET